METTVPQMFLDIGSAFHGKSVARKKVPIGLSHCRRVQATVAATARLSKYGLGSIFPVPSACYLAGPRTGATSAGMNSIRLSDAATTASAGCTVLRSSGEARRVHTVEFGLHSNDAISRIKKRSAQTSTLLSEALIERCNANQT